MKRHSPVEAVPATDATSGVLQCEQFRQLLDNSSVITAVKDLDGRYIHVNRPFVELLGGTAADYLGKSDSDLFPGFLSRQLQANDAEVLSLGAGKTFEEEFVLDARQRTFSTRKFPLFGTDGEVAGVCLMATDVTAQRRTEFALERIALSVSSATGPEVFDLIVANLADALGVQFAFIARIVEREPETLQALSAWYDGNFVEPPCYTSAGTPCADALAHGYTFISDSLGQTHPTDAMLAEFNFKSYAGFPLTGPDGESVGVLSVCHSSALPDASLVEHLLRIFSVRASAELQRAETESALRASEASYRTMFESAQDPILVHDMHTGAIVDMNHKACETFGYKREEMLQIGWGHLSSDIPPHTSDAAAALLRKAAEGQPQRVEWPMRNRDGSVHWDEVSLNRVTLSGVDRILAVTRDVTDRREREADLRRSERRLRATIEASLDAIIVMDTTGRVIAVNPAAVDCFGWQPDEINGQMLAELIIPERYREDYRRALEQHLRTGKSELFGRRSEIRALRRDGSEFPVELAVAVAPGRDGNIFVGYLRDISERQASERRRIQLEAQLRQAQKMEAIGHLAGGIAHDFNNVLTGALGYLGLARAALADRGAGGKDADQLDRYLVQATESASRAADLVRQLLTFSRGGMGNPEPLDLARVVRNGATLLHSTIPSSVEIEYQIEESVPRVFLDPVQAEQVLLNLCINARDAMDGRGRILIGLAPRTVEGHSCDACHEAVEGEFVELSIRDSGGGIAEDLRDRVFEPFFSTKPTGRGSGMGLAIVHGIVHEHGGHIELESEPGRGTTFKILLPVHQAAAAEPVAEPPSDVAGAGQLRGRVLVVDDQASVGRFMVDQLETFGLEAMHCPSPAEALGMLDGPESPADVVIVDYTMPEMNGLEFIEGLRKRQPRLPALLYSGYLEQIPEDTLARLDLPPPLEKPINTTELFRALQRLLPN